MVRVYANQINMILFPFGLTVHALRTLSVGITAFVSSSVYLSVRPFMYIESVTSSIKSCAKNFDET